jgi:hypothetical protein
MNYAAASHGNKLRLWDVADNVTGDICVFGLTLHGV